MSCAKATEPIEMPFGMLTQAGQRKHVLDGLHIGATWRIQLNRPCVAVMRPFCQITLTTCYNFYQPAMFLCSSDMLLLPLTYGMNYLLTLTAAVHLTTVAFHDAHLCRFGEKQTGAKCRTTKCLTLEACEMIAVSLVVLQFSALFLCLLTYHTYYLQCLDIVGWASGRASGM